MGLSLFKLDKSNSLIVQFLTQLTKAVFDLYFKIISQFILALPLQRK